MSQRILARDIVQNLQLDLEGKWDLHRRKIEGYWLAFHPRVRMQCLRPHTMIEAGDVPPGTESSESEITHEWRLGKLCEVFPGMDLAYLSVSPNTLFDALKSRATRSLQQQFFTGKMGRAGDRGYILDRVARQKEKEDLVTDEPADDFYTFFTNGDKYGRSFRISSLSKMGKEVRTEVDAAFRAGLCVPRSVGNLVLKRQISILSSLNALVDGILEAGKGREAAEMIKALDKLVIGQSEAQPSPSAPSAMAMDHEASLEEHLERLTTEPAVFAHSVNDCYLSRPELLPDEKGRMLPAAADKYPSWAVFDAVHHAVRSVAIWSYITRLVDHLTSLPDRRCSTRNNDFRLNLVQELANVCHLEYTLCQSAFRAHVQTGSGLKSFRRHSTPPDQAGRSTTFLKTKPQSLLPSNPHLHHVLRLCEPSTTPPQTLAHIQSLTALHAQTSPPSRTTSLSVRESSSLTRLTTITTLLTATLPLPPPSHFTHQTFTTPLTALDIELVSWVRPTFTLPPGGGGTPASAALLRSLDVLVSDKTGTALGFLYRDLVEDALANLVERLPPPRRWPRVQQRRERERTRPAGETEGVFCIQQRPRAAAAAAAADLKGETMRVEVSGATVETMQTLLGKTGGGLTWTAFCAAMEETGFTREERVGAAVVEFFSPAGMEEEGKGGVVVLRPQDGGDMEEWAVRGVGRRLRERFGFGLLEA